MEEMLDSGRIDACVTAHYNFPTGVATIGLAVSPGTGRNVYIASTTGISAPERVEAMVKNAVYGIAAAKASGITRPSVGVLNVDGAVTVLKTLRRLNDNGYDINLAESGRADGGSLMRGNDLLRGNADVFVADTLTGNILMKMLSSFTTGGGYESTGSGYGPGLGENFNRLVMILSRASGAPVAANAILYAAQLLKGNIFQKLSDEIDSARKAGLDRIIGGFRPNGVSFTDKADDPAFIPPAKEVVTEEIAGIDVMALGEAVNLLLKSGIYAESGMGCTGPVVLVSPVNIEKAKILLSEWV
jgi:glycine reductase